MMFDRRKITFRWLFKRVTWVIVLCGSLVLLVRFSKGVFFIDSFSLLTKPFLPGSAQKEWIQKGDQLEKDIRIQLLEADNDRLRKLLSLQTNYANERVSAAVISRSSKGWWQQLVINRGQNHGINKGDSVLGPGGLLGVIDGVTPMTSRVRLLTAPGNRLGSWVNRTKNHGVLIGVGTNRPKLRFLNKDIDVKIGDIVTTSPASTIMPPNLIIGVIQYLDRKALPTPYAIVQLIASPEAIDWVQIIKR